jgi:DNA-directed RNA polymerase specialized sigma24 family protein
MSAKRYFPNTCDEFLGSTAPSRASVVRLVTRVKVLPEADQTLIATIYLRHQTVATVAKLQGTSARAVRRRVYAIVRRVHTPEFIYVMRRRAQWPAQQRLIATAIFLHGLTMRQAARELKLPYFTVRRLRDTVLALIVAALGETARAKAAEEHGGDGGSQREQRGDWMRVLEEDQSSQVASLFPPTRSGTLDFPASSHFGEVA